LTIFKTLSSVPLCTGVLPETRLRASGRSPRIGSHTTNIFPLLRETPKEKGTFVQNVPSD
jgi:hypothetical protein